jgi:hypothetical protein
MEFQFEEFRFTFTASQQTLVDSPRRRMEEFFVGNLSSSLLSSTVLLVI